MGNGVSKSNAGVKLPKRLVNRQMLRSIFVLFVDKILNFSKLDAMD
ncbi:hypothetical protein CRENPOLYSF2_280007 [Crenothrix polyspora]|uniref:Uncharacterized protein n=1 Tax=Crenothrix polyspora TaxID=360316 RepID=A0A1R4H8R6_9GAMM|nr:hypothetical protein CRENPOLYSF2_280007 [Crenothrix polyspora]